MLTSGSRLGAYEIVSPQGAGGMGEVYKARDTRLDRLVAIKILPHHFSSSPDFHERFQREAKAIASLSHPNICALFDVGQQDGTDYLVMEFLQGDTLEQSLAKGAMPLERALDIGIHIADALAAAHRAGIVHRDLKPGNIMLTRSGVKLLDFGLAKAAAASAGGRSMLTTTPPGLTVEGTILGTFPYMAPEQLQGEEADQRSDIFAFGAVLYEMITGHRAFDGKSQASLIAAILDRQLPPVSLVQSLASPTLDRTVARCLAKNPDERWQSASDLAMSLRWELEGRVAPGQSQSALARDSPRRRRGLFLWGAYLAAAAVIGGVAVAAASRYYQVADPVPQVVRFEWADGPTLVSGLDFYISIAPDGRRVAYTAVDAAGTRHIWIRAMDSLDSRMLAGTQDARSLFWSPDSRYVAFGQDRRLMKVEASGTTPPETLTEIDGIAGIGSWHGNGTIIFGGRGPGQGGLRRVAATGGAATQITAVREGQQAHSYPVFLPDGEHFIYLALSTNPDIRGFYLGALSVAPEAQPQARLMPAQYGASYVPLRAGIGLLLYQRERTVMAQEFDEQRLAPIGEARRIADNVGAAGSSGYFAASTGMLAFRDAGGGGAQLRWFARTGSVLEEITGEGAYAEMNLSPDATRLAVYQTDGQQDVWVRDLARTSSNRVTLGNDPERGPVWSPDGKMIAYSSLGNIYRTAADGTGSPQLLRSNTGSILDWSADGCCLLYQTNTTTTNADLWMLPLGGDRMPVPLLVTPQDETAAKFSPDSKWFVYRSNRSGSSEIYVQPFVRGPADRRTGQTPVSIGGGWQPRWSANGREILYLAPNGRLMSVSVSAAGGAFVAATPKPLFDLPILGGATAAPVSARWDVTRDGMRIVANVEASGLPRVSRVHIVENWQQLLKP